ncbi:hypothetical protein N480_00285 [Pseudoalteromonas luteoviolacea S2607]|nr:hypothetical protein N480_00285 [Pseudoalteromonas luteoviolacea S2607]
MERLDNEFGKDKFDIVDHWEGDFFAIAKPDNHGILAYISMINCATEKYDVHLELPARGSEEVYIDAGVTVDIGFKD